MKIYFPPMKRISSWLLPVVASLVFLTATESFAQVTNAAVPSNAIINTAIVPAPRDAKWVTRHEGFVQETQKGGIYILFLGDSITDGWRDKGSNVWNKYYTPRHAANFGIGGDRSEERRVG